MGTPNKTLIGFGIMMFIVGAIATIWGFAIADDGEVVYSGEAPATWNHELVWTSTYYIYVEEGSDVSVELFVEGGIERPYEGSAEFVTCQVAGDCKTFDDQDGFDYVGHLLITDDDTYNVNFQGQGSILIIETDDTGLVLIGLGSLCCICCSIPLLILGGLLGLLKSKKGGNKDVNIVVLPDNYPPHQPSPNNMLGGPKGGVAAPIVAGAQPNNTFGIDYEKATVYRNKWLRDVSVPTDPKKFNEIDVDSLSEGELFSWLALLDIKERDVSRGRSALKRKFNHYATGTMDVYTTNVPINHPYRCSKYPNDDRMAKMHTASIPINEHGVFEMFGQPCPEPGCDGFIEPNIPR